jgi:UDP-N-acetyl-D-glucosamine dehydrogenase
MKQTAEALLEKVRQKNGRVGIIGLGYVGLPLAVEFAKAGLQVTGLDLDRERVKALNAGRCYIPDVSADDVGSLVASGKLRADVSAEVLKTLDIVIICVPTPLRKTKDPDLSYIVSAVEEIGRYLHTGQLIILESTTYPGTTEEVVLPILEKSGLAVGKDFFLGFSPERVDPGNKKYAIRNTPKVVAGLTPDCTRLIEALYRHVAETVVPVSSTKVAETVKLLENTFRSVNIVGQ